MLFVDDRWAEGLYGIGRYASEVLARLDLPFRPLGVGRRPSSPLDTLRRIPAGRADTLYNPGYNGFLRSPARQFVTMHDLIHLDAEERGTHRYRAYYSGVLRPIVRRAGLVFTVSDFSAGRIREWVRDDDVEIVNAAGGCSDAFRPDGEAQAFDRPTVLYVGNLRIHKNVATLCAALARTPEFGAVVVVPRSQAEEARGLLAAAGLDGRSEVVSGVTDERLAALYRGAAATALPSILEGFGLPALESVRCGTPVVYWRGCRPVGEIVGGGGIAVEDAYDVEAWSAALREAVGTTRDVPGPPPGSYTWDAAGETVTRALAARV